MASPWLGDGSFLVGANLPWICYGCDFGANRWQVGGGLARPEASARARDLLHALAGAGARAVRWFVLADGRAGLRLDGRGRLLGLDDRFFADFDAAVRLLHETGLAAIFVLLDFTWFVPAQIVKGVQIGGRTRLLARRSARRHLLDTVVTPILERHGQDPAIVAWDVINEPEWATTRRPWVRRGRVSPSEMRAFIREVTALVHGRTCHMATVGSACVASLPLVAGLGLDFYQVHWYEELRAPFDLDRAVAGLGVNRPVLLGEFPTRGSARTPRSIIETARASGYAGAFAWSMVPQDTASNRRALEAGIRAWNVEGAMRQC
jgi:hypothetical protein